MSTLFAVYNLKADQKADEYDNYLINTKIPGVRGAPWCTEFTTWKIEKFYKLKKKLNFSGNR